MHGAYPCSYLATPHRHVALATSHHLNCMISVAFPFYFLPHVKDSIELTSAPAIHFFGGLPLVA